MEQKRGLKSKDAGKVFKGYVYRIYPNSTQRRTLAQQFGASRFVYNHCLNRAIEQYERDGSRFNALELRNHYVRGVLDKEHPWLKTDIYSSMLDQTVVKDLNSAFAQFFKRRNEGVGFPRFKRKRDRKQSFGLPYGIKVHYEKNLVQLPKKCGGLIKTKFHRPLPENYQIKTSRVIMTTTGKYYVSLSVIDNDTYYPETHIFDPDKVLGIDVGIKDMAVLSTGEKIGNPKPLDSSLKRLKVLSRRLSRKKKGSKNRGKAARRLAKLHERISNQRHHFQHIISHRIINDSEIQAIAIENLNVKGMMGNKKLARHISDVGWHSFVLKLEYKAKLAGKAVIRSGQWDATSKTCHVCGYKRDDLPLQIREWQCPECGTDHDRDINAAKNIVKFALKNYRTGGSTAEEPVDSFSLEKGMKQEPTCVRG